MLVPLAPILALLILPQDAVPPAPAPRPPERVRVGLVLIDAAVRDRKDRPIRGLGLGDFELRIDGQLVPSGSIPVFEEICQAESVVGARAEAQGAPSAATPGRDGDSPASGNMVLLFDFTALTFPARQLALTAARHFFESRMAPLVRTRIQAHVDGYLITIQDFTSDVSTLKQGIATLAEDLTTIDRGVAPEMSPVKPGPDCIKDALALSLYEQERTRRSLDRLGRAVVSLRDIHGPKSIVLMSDSLRHEPGAQHFAACKTSPFFHGINVLGDIEALTDAAEASGVSIHTVHALGLDYSPVNVVGLDAAHGMQATLALQTGGRSLRNTNDLGSILVTAQQDLACRYELGWAPATEVPDGRRHTISLQLTDAARKNLPRGIQVRHRPFYVDRAR